MVDDHIEMQVPGTATSVPLIRLAAAQLAAQSGFDYDRVEDVRIAVSESIRILIGTPGDGEQASEPGVPRLDVDFTVRDGSLTVAVALDGEGDPPGADDDSVEILEATATTIAIDTTNPHSPVVTVHFGANS